MSAVLRACAVCAKPSPGPYCREHQRERWTNKRQSRMGIGGGSWEAIRRRVIARDQRVCYLCDQVVAEGEPIEVDHLVEVSEGGSNDLSNLATAHASPCHRRRHREPEWAAERIERALRSLGGGGGHPDSSAYVGTLAWDDRAGAALDRGDE